MNRKLNLMEKALLSLLEEENLVEVKKILNSMNIFDIAAFFDTLDKTNLTLSFNLLTKDNGAKVFPEMDIEQQKLLIEGFSNLELEEIINKIRMDDKVDMIEELPSNLVKKVLRNSNPKDRAIINTMLNYPKDSAGSVMTTEYLRLKPNMTVNDAIDYIRDVGSDKETIDMCYVIDETRHLIGEVSLRDIILADVKVPITSIMKKDFVKTTTTVDREEVAHMFSKYDITTMPVVDGENRLVGIITVDDVIDIIKEETTEDMEIMSAVTPSEKPYKQLSVTTLWKNRFPWLLVLLLSATFTSLIIMKYEDALAKYVVLTAFIPMITDTGGNAGSQSASTIIRSLSLKEIDFHDFFYVLWKEFRVAIACGLTLAVFNFAKLTLLDKLGARVSLVISMTLFSTVLIAKAVGSVLPIIADKLGFDPAVMASPLITTVVDALAILVYLNIAITILGA
ncbi:magnesium transporter [Miniphocaeibacter halophilus]|uniref:Magnesium transporter n=1 Tax=Miniphocaeibacter halophilus TaxID=2931922 RepID=A0AC61MTH4_9FIRM|nr:magnesium transporter [Miniphocaeibacter halophilus]QQK08683.1 magnesium transporter [Miniphocaeibacter halophilus]